jgi:chemotaxis-related protein WspD
MTPLPLATVDDCWNRIGFQGDRSCPELDRVVHCHNCAVFGNAGRRFLDAPSPEGYAEEWTRRLADPIEESPADLVGVLVFRLGEEWLALPVGLLVEVTAPRPVHRVPRRGGVLAGLVNIRGELHLCAHLDAVLGVGRIDHAEAPKRPQARFLVVRREGERWVFPVDEVDEVHRFSRQALTGSPATLSRSLARLTRGVFHHGERSVGLLDEERLFHTLRGKTR